MSKTNSAQCASPTPVPFNQYAWDVQVQQAQQVIAVATLTTILQGTNASMHSRLSTKQHIRSRRIHNLVRCIDVRPHPVRQNQSTHGQCLTTP